MQEQHYSRKYMIMKTKVTTKNHEDMSYSNNNNDNVPLKSTASIMKKKHDCDFGNNDYCQSSDQNDEG